jgi:hypothetical protein
MQRQLVTAAGAALMLGIVAACGVTTANEQRESVMAERKSDAPARTSASYALRQGQAVTLGPGTTLKLERVNDSRCKKGAVCVWAGYISYTFKLTNPAGTRDFILAENMPNASPTVTQDGLTFALENLEPPEPPEMHATALPDYRINVRVTIAQPN